jgi:hypothetical protein
MSSRPLPTGQRSSLVAAWCEPLPEKEAAPSSLDQHATNAKLAAALRPDRPRAEHLLPLETADHPLLSGIVPRQFRRMLHPKWTVTKVAGGSLRRQAGTRDVSEGWVAACPVCLSSPSAGIQFERRRRYGAIMVWPGLTLWRPPIGFIAWLPREHYDPGDQKDGRPTVVIKYIEAERACWVVGRTTSMRALHGGDVVHQRVPETPGLDKVGWWQAWRPYRVLYSAYDDPDVIEYAKLDENTLQQVIKKYMERP